MDGFRRTLSSCLFFSHSIGRSCPCPQRRRCCKATAVATSPLRRRLRLSLTAVLPVSPASGLCGLGRHRNGVRQTWEVEGRPIAGKYADPMLLQYNTLTSSARQTPRISFALLPRSGRSGHHPLAAAASHRPIAAENLDILPARTRRSCLLSALQLACPARAARAACTAAVSAWRLESAAEITIFFRRGWMDGTST